MKQTLFFSLVFFSVLSVAAQKKGPVLNHIAQYVTSLQKGTAFYQQVIGLDTIPEPFHDGKHTWFRIAEHAHLHLIEGATAPSPLGKNSHLCFSVPSLDALIKKLDAARIPYEDWAGKRSAITLRKDGVHQIYFQDPDGYWIEANDDHY
jgi:lactoylglutathione lyase